MTEQEALWLLECFNGVMTEPGHVVANILGWIPYGSPMPEQLLAKVRSWSPERLQQFCNNCVCWTEESFEPAKRWLMELQPEEQQQIQIWVNVPMDVN